MAPHSIFTHQLHLEGFIHMCNTIARDKKEQVALRSEIIYMAMLFQESY